MTSKSNMVKEIETLKARIKVLETFDTNQIKEAILRGRQEATKDEISFIKKVIEKLNGYACGYHKELDRMLSNEIKRLKK